MELSGVNQDMLLSLSVIVVIRFAVSLLRSGFGNTNLFDNNSKTPVLFCILQEGTGI